ncbi:MAG: TIGR03960 family B12-binding radical SAM protein [Planctomycetes bacterium]|nr:TIGR03960 family B12-binding radical SAM protein [Planctomycetota bacterium]
MSSGDALGLRVSRELLPRVEQPAQYIGGELNQLAMPGDWQRAEIRVAVCFPDTYAIGMSHLGCQILYWLCNHTPGVCAERVFAPWIDAEEVMRERAIGLFTWDTRQPVASADILGISLQYELCFTTVLNLLNLAGIPLRSEDRWRGPASAGEFGEWPLVIVGGPQADNPEPMADFVDLVVIGDGEHSMAAIVDAVREYKRAGVPRRDMILELARRFPWIYAPNLYDIAYNSDGTIAGMTPRHEGLPTRIQRCQTPDFDAAPFPTRPLVPWIPAIHDRVGIEVMRGCPQVCRFCHAGYTKRPLHLRSVDRILEIAEEGWAATGHHEIGLLSLSTADYPYLKDLAERFNERFTPRHVNLSFPSLRIDKMLQNIPWMGNSVRKGSITMAVEAARDDMRAAIRKKVTDGNLLAAVREVYKAGWNRLKLYFMCGFPGERDEDIFGIWEIANAVSRQRQALGKPPAEVNASIGWLVPKPFTPLQWMAQPRLEYFRSVREKLWSLGRPGKSRGARGTGGTGVSPVNHAADSADAPLIIDGGMGGYGSAAGMAAENDEFAARMRDPRNAGGRWAGRKSAVRISTPDPRRSILEGVMARGDRRLGRAILEAWKRGARLDGWDECYRDDAWQAAFAAADIDPAWYAHRERSFDEILPWDHIGLHMRRGYLEESYDGMFETLGAGKPAAGVTPLPLAPD